MCIRDRPPRSVRKAVQDEPQTIARRLQGQGRNHGDADFLGGRAWDKAISGFLRARLAASRCWTLGLGIGFEIIVN
eukprot:9143731-Alexandrium_andersonii.AAC.1